MADHVSLKSVHIRERFTTNFAGLQQKLYKFYVINIPFTTQQQYTYKAEGLIIIK